MKKVLITGGAGFIGRNLSEQLISEYNITSLDVKELDLLNSSKVFDYIKKNQFDVVIHTAIYDALGRFSEKDPEKILENNLKMFFNIVRCKDYFGKMIYFGSGAEFGRENWMPKMKEDYFDKHVPTDQYGFSKYIMTKYIQLNSEIYNLRLFGVFGKYDDWRTRLIPNVCCYAVMNLPIKIEQDKFYDFLSVDDLVRIVKWFIDNKPKHKIYNICTEKINSFKNLAEKIIKISGKDLDINIKKAGLGREYSGENKLLMNELSKFKFSSIDDKLRELYNWYNLNKKIIKIDEL